MLLTDLELNSKMFITWQYLVSATEIQFITKDTIVWFIFLKAFIIFQFFNQVGLTFTYQTDIKIKQVIFITSG